MTSLSRPEYIRIKLSDIPNKIIKECNLLEKATKDGSIYIEANKSMYGLPHTGLLANDLLKNDSTSMVTTRANWFLAFGSMIGAPFSSYS